MASNLLATINGLQPSSDGLQLNSSVLPPLIAMASNRRALNMAVFKGVLLKDVTLEFARVLHAGLQALRPSARVEDGRSVPSVED